MYSCRHLYPELQLIIVQVKLEISKQLSTAKEDLKQLGPKRSTPDEQRQYLLDISTHFQEIARNALHAHYVSNDWFDEFSDTLRFATIVRNRNELFAHELQAYGQLYRFENEEFDDSSEIAQSEQETASVSSDQETDTDTELNPRKTLDHEALDEVTGDTSKSITKAIQKGIIPWLTKTNRTSRGFELGTFNPSLLATTFKYQSTKWEGLAVGYIGDIITMAHVFIEMLLGLICSDFQVKESLMSELAEGLMAKYRAAMAGVQHLLWVERKGTPGTTNHYFSETLEKAFVLTISLSYELPLIRT